MKRRIVLFFCALIAVASAAPDWTDVRVSVVPGVGIKDFELGEPLPNEWPKELGQPDLTFEFHGTGERLRRLIWGDVAKGQLSKGIAVMAEGIDEESMVIEVELKQIRAGVDGENLFLGLSEDTISQRSNLVQKDGKRSYLLPGLTIETSDGKMVSLRIHSPHETRWRFKQWRLRPGIAAGPVRLGEPVGRSLFSSIGSPHTESREQLVWRASDSSQMLLIEREARTGSVTRIHSVGLPWRTQNGVTLGDTEESFVSKHPEARSGAGRAYSETIQKLPGMRATFLEGKLTGFDVY